MAAMGQAQENPLCDAQECPEVEPLAAAPSLEPLETEQNVDSSFSAFLPPQVGQSTFPSPSLGKHSRSNTFPQEWHLYS